HVRTFTMILSRLHVRVFKRSEPEACENTSPLAVNDRDPHEAIGRRAACRHVHRHAMPDLRAKGHSSAGEHDEAKQETDFRAWNTTMPDRSPAQERHADAGPEPDQSALHRRSSFAIDPGHIGRVEILLPAVGRY